jgi:hypothetical protein
MDDMTKYHNIDLAMFNLRTPVSLWNRLRDYQREHPHFSLNSLVVEAIQQFLDKQTEKGGANAKN